MRSLDLFSCIGCHALGFRRAGIETVAMCEINMNRRAVLWQQFNGVYIEHDVRSIDAKQYKAEIVIGGPPCQSTSVAAAIHGRRDGRSLWRYMLRAGLDVGAEWFVVEQPPGHATWEAKVARDLATAGYHCARAEFAACDIGAPFLRRRVFILACTSLPRLEVAWRALPSEIEAVKRAANARGDWNADQLRSVRVDARSAGEMDAARSFGRKARIEALGDSNPPHMAEVIGRAILCAA